MLTVLPESRYANQGFVFRSCFSVQFSSSDAYALCAYLSSTRTESAGLGTQRLTCGEIEEKTTHNMYVFMYERTRYISLLDGYFFPTSPPFGFFVSISPAVLHMYAMIQQLTTAQHVVIYFRGHESYCTSSTLLYE